MDKEKVVKTAVKVAVYVVAAAVVIKVVKPVLDKLSGKS